MIIFGWGFQTTKQIGVAFKYLCSHCHNEEYWVLTRITTWFTLFFIPVIPYSVKHFLSCPVCKYGLTLDQKQIDDIKPLAEINQLLLDGKITQEQYQARISALNSVSSSPIEAEAVEAKALEISTKKVSYCANCGTGLENELKFCGNCGTQVSK